MEVKKIVTPLDSKQKIILATITLQAEFVPVANEKANCCVSCCFFDLCDCSGMPCVSSARSDGKNGYFKRV